nr:MAG TPA: hypothetical protein [Caudoviricetes sp.]
MFYNYKKDLSIMRGLFILLESFNCFKFISDSENKD